MLRERRARISPDRVREQLEQILISKDFKASERNRKFLRYVVEQTLAGRAKYIKQYSIAVEAFGHDSSFDPQVDPMIRLEAGYIRRALERYYMDAGQNDGIVLSIPKGGYIPSFIRRVDKDPREAIINQSDSSRLSHSNNKSSWNRRSKAEPLSIMVLPFVNLSNNPGDELFADGIVDDLTTCVSRISGTFVIARNTAFTYKGLSLDAKLLGRKLGVLYLVSGSVQRIGGQVRVNVQLIDTRSGGNVWVDQLDGSVGDLFAMHEQVTANLARTLQLNLIEAAARSAASHYPDAVDLILRGRAAVSRPRTEESLAVARHCFEQALQLAPDATDAKVGLAEVLSSMALSLPSENRAVDLGRADRLISEALIERPESAWAHHVRGEILRGQRQPDRAMVQYQQSIALDRNYLPAIASLGLAKILIGEPQEALPLLLQAIRISPNDPLLAIWHTRIGLAEIFMERFDRAAAALGTATSLTPGLPWAHFHLASSIALMNRLDDARASLNEAQRLSPELGSVAKYKWLSHITHPKAVALREATLVRGLKLAGLPDS